MKRSPAQIMLLFTFVISSLLTGQENVTNVSHLLSFLNNGSKVSGSFFRAQGDKPLPTVILLQGFPGREGDVLGIGNYMMQNGINAYTFNYRGSFKSEGSFSIENAVDDLKQAAEFLSTEEISHTYGIDTSKLVVIGYSFGGGIAMLGASSSPRLQNIISVAGTDFKILADKLEEDTLYKRKHLQALESGNIIMGGRSAMSAEESHKWLSKHKEELSLLRIADSFSSKRVLLIGGLDDNMVLIEEVTLPLYRRLLKKKTDCSINIFNSNHSFNNVFPELHKLIADWILKDNRAAAANN